MTQFRGCLISSQLRIILTTTPLLVNPRACTDDRKPYGYHEYDRDPVRRVPAKDYACAVCHRLYNKVTPKENATRICDKWVPFFDASSPLSTSDAIITRQTRSTIAGTWASNTFGFLNFQRFLKVFSEHALTSDRTWHGSCP